ncbi:MAG TPA: MMPL family transporter [Candidatus Dormibacteraeota bacterium]|jgi:RND superfamily putative drug exporter|nr:MMPL family transporter [Candidatus Dormibacteraeota bacterium]
MTRGKKEIPMATAPPSTNLDSWPARMAHRLLRHRRLVFAFWAVVFVAGLAGSGAVSNRFTLDFSLPGQPGYETARQISRTFGNGGDTAPAIAVVTLPQGQTVAANQASVSAAFDQVRHAESSLRVVDYAATQDARFITNDGRSTFALLFEPIPKTFGSDTVGTAAQATLRTALPAAHIGLTGLTALQTGGDATGPGVLVETLIGGAGALVVLAIVFASFLALVPLLIAAVSILTTLLVVLGLTYVTDISFIVEFLVSLVGLGVAIDYSLLVVTRWREERALGADNATAVITAVATAGRAVLLSGLTVAIGLIALVVLPVPGLRSVGIGGMLIPVVSVLVSLTLLPALLGGIGARMDWPQLRHEAQASRVWSRWARMVVRHRVAAAAIGAAILAVLVVPIFSLKVGMTSASAQAQNGAAHDAYQTLLDGGVPAGVLTPIEVLTTADTASATRARLAAVPGVTTADVPAGTDGTRGGYSDVIALPQQETVNSDTLAVVDSATSALTGAPGVVGVSGIGAIETAYGNAVFGNFPLMFALITLATFVLLTRAFRSPLLAAKAVLLNLVSLAATFGLLTFFWQQGHGSHLLFGIPATGAITFWIPLMIFAFLFGLSMDYEVFILTRVREEYDRTGSTTSAVISGLARTGRLVTSAALILFLAFGSLASAPNTDIKVLATGLGAGILLDATVVRALLVPALVALFGNLNWWMPRWVERVLFIKAAPAPPQRIAADEAETAA